MKVQVGRNELLAALQAVIGVVERRQTLPVLANFLLETAEDELIVTGTDLEMELVGRARIQNLHPGRLTVPARKLFEICKSLPEGAVITLELQGDKLAVRSGRSRFMLSTLAADEFPSMGLVQAQAVLRLTRAQLSELLARTSFAMAQQDVRYYLNGLLLEITPERIRAVATDGHRLALSEMRLPTHVSEPLKVILPRKSVNEMSRLLGSGNEEIEMVFGQGQVQVSIDIIRVTTKLIDGRFPDYERVIPERGDKKLVIDREGFRKALSRAAILSNEKFRGVRLSLEQNLLSLQTHNPEHEEAEEEVEVAYDAGSIQIGFNVGYLLDALAVMDSETVVLEMKNADSSGLLYEEGSQASRYVIMPMRL